MAGIAPKIYESRRNESRGRETPVLKSSRLSGNFCFYETEFPVSEKIRRFSCNAGQFLIADCT